MGGRRSTGSGVRVNVGGRRSTGSRPLLLCRRPVPSLKFRPRVTLAIRRCANFIVQSPPVLLQKRPRVLLSLFVGAPLLICVMRRHAPLLNALSQSSETCFELSSDPHSCLPACPPARLPADPWVCFARCFRHGVSHSMHVRAASLAQCATPLRSIPHRRRRWSARRTLRCCITWYVAVFALLQLRCPVSDRHVTPKQADSIFI